ncbi:hypothetical protein QOT17_018140 [Balamuthia mandrillaris]
MLPVGATGQKLAKAEELAESWTEKLPGVVVTSVDKRLAASPASNYVEDRSKRSRKEKALCFPRIKRRQSARHRDGCRRGRRRGCSPSSKKQLSHNILGRSRSALTFFAAVGLSTTVGEWFKKESAKDLIQKLSTL